MTNTQVKTHGVHPHDNVGEKCEFKAYHETMKGGIPSSEPISDPFDNLGVRTVDSAYSLVIRRTFEENKPKKTTLQVNSPHILKAFRDTIGSYAPVPSDFKSSVELKSPFEMLVHHWDDLDEYRHSVGNADARKHLDLLFEFMEHEIKPDRDCALKMIQDNKIAYQNAWVIYRPGDILYSESGGQPWLLVCKKTAYESNAEQGPYLEVHCTYTDHTGEYAGDATQMFTMLKRAKFPAENPVPITDLSVYPRRFVGMGDALERRLRLRGEKYLSLKDMSTMAYDGPAEWLKEPPFDYYDPSSCKFRGVWLSYTETGRVVLDRKTFSEEQPLGKPKVTMADPKPWLCPPSTVGFSLGRKNWCKFLVDKVTDVHWSPNAWDSLVLPAKEKLLLKSLITSHEYSKIARDHMAQKGKGLVILLHGTPGSGKTLTAETAAEGSKKALVSTSVGELNRGSNIFGGSSAFEKELKKTLQYATIWKAVVLLDEADVFLEARKDNSSERNAMVAIFLRQLEYFSGIVFLTTNRVESFDMAMKSRIHLSLGYKPPELEVRRRIWQQCLKTVSAEAIELDVERAVDQLVPAKLNGREIANAVNTAQTMARFEETPLKLEHIETVLEVRRAFDDSLKSDGLPST